MKYYLSIKLSFEDSITNRSTNLTVKNDLLANKVFISDIPFQMHSTPRALFRVTLILLFVHSTENKLLAKFTRLVICIVFQGCLMHIGAATRCFSF